MDKTLVINSVIKDIKNKKEKLKAISGSRNNEAYQERLNELKNTEAGLYELMDCISNPENAKTEAFLNALKSAAGVKGVSDNDAIILNYMKQSIGESGGFTVPEDIQVDVKAIRNDGTNLEAYVNVEPIIRSSGSRLMEIRADETPLEEIQEGETIPEIDESNIAEVKYKIKKRAGIIKVTNELLTDTDNALLKWLKVWLAKKTRATRNRAILDRINEVTAGKETAVNSAKDLRTVFYKKLESYHDSLVAITNSSGFDYLDCMVDENGDKILLPDIANKQKLLFGLYPVKKVSDKALKNAAVFDTDGVTVLAYKYPVICGDLKEAITLFDRENLSIDLSSNGDTFFYDLTKIKVRDRIDVQAIDEEAVIKAEIEVTA